MEAPVKDSKYSQAIISFIIGVASLCVSLVPLCGLPLSIAGLILGIKGLNSPQRIWAIAGIVLCALGVLLGIGWAVVGAYIAPINQFLQQ